MVKIPEIPRVQCLFAEHREFDHRSVVFDLPDHHVDENTAGSRRGLPTGWGRDRTDGDLTLALRRSEMQPCLRPDRSLQAFPQLIVILALWEEREYW